jgi:RNA polymerase sigma-70 factor, ECF subfamily
MAAATLFLTSRMTDDRKVLATALRRRDPEVLDSLIEQYQYRLFRYLLHLTAHRETAEDLFQETWVRVLDRGHQYDGRAKFETWLFAIARHLVFDLQRRKTPRSFDSLGGDEESGVPEFAAADPSPLDVFARLESEQNVAACLERLPAILREALVLRFQEDMALEEIAAVAGAPLSTVKSRLYRGLEALRGFLEGAEK